MTKKYTRPEVLKMVDAIKQVGYSEAADMLLDLAPPDEPRAWQVGDFLRWDGRDCVVLDLGKLRARLATITREWEAWVEFPKLDADAIPLKLVPMEDGR